MILHPPVLALVVGALLSSFMVILAGWYGVAILRKWDLRSGSELQVGLERKTYLISTLVGYLFGFQLLSLFLFVYVADDLARLFTGAMCAVGTLHVNVLGYPALGLKMANFVLAGIWLVLNYVDNRAYDYPLIRAKYWLLLLIAPLLLIETVVLIRYFRGLNPDIITSCCSTLFTPETVESGGGEIASLAGVPSMVAFFLLIALTLMLGLYVHQSRGRGAYILALMSGGSFVVSILALISVFAPYIYELPTHHCPFCLLQGDYGYVGYPLYLTLFGGVVAGIATGVIAPAQKIPSLERIVPETIRRLTLTMMICHGVFTLIVSVEMVTSNLIGG